MKESTVANADRTGKQQQAAGVEQTAMMHNIEQAT